MLTMDLAHHPTKCAKNIEGMAVSLLMKVVAALGASLCLSNMSWGTDGYFDSTWAGGGRITLTPDPSQGSFGIQAAVDANGNIVLLGEGGQIGVADYWFLGGLSSDGTVIPTFGESDGTGLVSSCQLGFACAGAPDGALQLLIQPDGKYLVLSDRDIFRTTAQANALDTQGVVGGTGFVSSIIPINNQTGVLYSPAAFALQPDGKIVVAGSGVSVNGIGPIVFAIARLNTDLSIDTTFNAVTADGTTFAGGVLIPVQASDMFEVGSSVFVLPDGRITIVGTGSTASGDLVLEAARVMPDGSLDTSFGNNGVAAINWPSGVLIFQTFPAAMDSAGRIVIAETGTTTIFSITGMVIARINSDGSLDTTFSDGFAFDEYSSACTSMYANSLALDTAGRILIGGTCETSSAGIPFFIARLRGDTGLIDASFGVNGYGLGHFLSGNIDDGAYSITFDHGGRPIVAGFTSQSGPYKPTSVDGIARLTYDLIFTNNFDLIPQGCLSPNCD
jgi:uncharacterized delta-60 repeat protein